MYAPHVNHLLKLGAMSPMAHQLNPTDDNPDPHTPPAMLSLSFRDGRSCAFAYAHLYQLEFDGEGHIALHFSAHVVRLDGQDLDGIYHRLLNHEVRDIAETDALHIQARTATEQGNVTSITVTPQDHSTS